MSDEQALLRAVLETPFDDAPRLVYADWLDEHAQPERAAFIRLQCEHARLMKVHPRSSESLEWKAQCEAILDGPSPASVPFRKLWADPIDPQWGDRYFFRRGFVSQVSVTAGRLVRLAGRLFAEHPITRVHLSDKRPNEAGGPGWAWCWGAAYLQNSPDVIPDPIWELLWREFPPGFGVEYGSEEEALDALSRAYVRYGRQLAGLPIPTHWPTLLPRKCG